MTRKAILTVRSRSPTPQNVREAFTSVVQTGKTIIQKSKNAIVAASCLIPDSDEEDATIISSSKHEHIELGYMMSQFQNEDKSVGDDADDNDDDDDDDGGSGVGVVNKVLDSEPLLPLLSIDEELKRERNVSAEELLKSKKEVISCAELKQGGEMGVDGLGEQGELIEVQFRQEDGFSADDELKQQEQEFGVSNWEERVSAGDLKQESQMNSDEFKREEIEREDKFKRDRKMSGVQLMKQGRVSTENLNREEVLSYESGALHNKLCRQELNNSDPQSQLKDSDFVLNNTPGMAHLETTESSDQSFGEKNNGWESYGLPHQEDIVQNLKKPLFLADACVFVESGEIIDISEDHDNGYNSEDVFRDDFITRKEIGKDGHEKETTLTHDQSGNEGRIETKTENDQNSLELEFTTNDWPSSDLKFPLDDHDHDQDKEVFIFKSSMSDVPLEEATGSEDLPRKTLSLVMSNEADQDRDITEVMALISDEASLKRYASCHDLTELQSEDERSISLSFATSNGKNNHRRGKLNNGGGVFSESGKLNIRETRDGKNDDSDREKDVEVEAEVKVAGSAMAGRDNEIKTNYEMGEDRIDEIDEIENEPPVVNVILPCYDTDDDQRSSDLSSSCDDLSSQISTGSQKKTPSSSQATPPNSPRVGIQTDTVATIISLFETNSILRGGAGAADEDASSPPRPVIDNYRALNNIDDDDDEDISAEEDDEKKNIVVDSSHYYRNEALILRNEPESMSDSSSTFDELILDAWIQDEVKKVAVSECIDNDGKGEKSLPTSDCPCAQQGEERAEIDFDKQSLNEMVVDANVEKQSSNEMVVDGFQTDHKCEEPSLDMERLVATLPSPPDTEIPETIVGDVPGLDHDNNKASTSNACVIEIDNSNSDDSGLSRLRLAFQREGYEEAATISNQSMVVGLGEKGTENPDEMLLLCEHEIGENTFQENKMKVTTSMDVENNNSPKPGCPDLLLLGDDDTIQIADDSGVMKISPPLSTMQAHAPFPYGNDPFPDENDPLADDYDCNVILESCENKQTTVEDRKANHLVVVTDITDANDQIITNYDPKEDVDAKPFEMSCNDDDDIMADSGEGGDNTTVLDSARTSCRSHGTEVETAGQKEDDVVQVGLRVDTDMMNNLEGGSNFLDGTSTRVSNSKSMSGDADKEIPDNDLENNVELECMKASKDVPKSLDDFCEKRQFHISQAHNDNTDTATEQNIANTTDKTPLPNGFRMSDYFFDDSPEESLEFGIRASHHANHGATPEVKGNKSKRAISYNDDSAACCSSSSSHSSTLMDAIIPMSAAAGASAGRDTIPPILSPRKVKPVTFKMQQKRPATITWALGDENSKKDRSLPLILSESDDNDDDSDGGSIIIQRNRGGDAYDRSNSCLPKQSPSMFEPVNDEQRETCVGHKSGTDTANGFRVGNSSRLAQFLLYTGALFPDDLSRDNSQLFNDGVSPTRCGGGKSKSKPDALGIDSCRHELSTSERQTHVGVNLRTSTTNASDDDDVNQQSHGEDVCMKHVGFLRDEAKINTWSKFSKASLFIKQESNKFLSDKITNDSVISLSIEPIAKNTINGSPNLITSACSFPVKRMCKLDATTQESRPKVKVTTDNNRDVVSQISSNSNTQLLSLSRMSPSCSPTWHSKPDIILSQASKSNLNRMSETFDRISETFEATSIFFDQMSERIESNLTGIHSTCSYIDRAQTHLKRSNDMIDRSTETLRKSAQISALARDQINRVNVFLASGRRLKDSPQKIPQK